MGINKVQFQKGLSMVQFMERYGTEEKCHAAAVALRWPDGFVCPECGETRHCIFERKGLTYWQCSACREQTTVMCGTIFEATKLPLTTWFLAMHLLTQAKNNVSALELTRHLGVRYKTAWLLKHKLMQVMCEREAPRQLDGRVEIDDAYLGGELPGGKSGRGSENKVSFIAAVQTTDTGRPLRVCLKKLEFHQGSYCRMGEDGAGRLGARGVRWPVVLSGGYRRGSDARAHRHRRRPELRQVGAVPRRQYLPGQSEDRLLGYLPFLRLCQVRASLSCRGPISFQSSFRFVVHLEVSAGCHGENITATRAILAGG